MKWHIFYNGLAFIFLAWGLYKEERVYLVSAFVLAIISQYWVWKGLRKKGNKND